MIYNNFKKYENLTVNKKVITFLIQRQYKVAAILIQ